MVVGEFAQECDLVVIGGGPGGYAAAFRAAELGVSTTIIDERSQLGGVCLHAGCVPSKTLLNLADTIDRAKRAAPMGVTYGDPTIDRPTVDGWVDTAVQRLAKGLDGECARRSIDVIAGRAAFEDNRHLSLQGGSVRRVKFRRAIIATGGRPEPHPVAEHNGTTVRWITECMRTETMPKRVLIIGGIYCALECATIARSLGSEVHLITPNPRWLPECDADLVRPFERRWKKSLASFKTATDVSAVQHTDAGLTCSLSDDSTIEVDGIILATGFVPNTSDLNAPVDRDETGAIIVDDMMQTSNARMFAVGDVTGAPMLADRALRQGRVAAEVVAGMVSMFDARACPHAIFTMPNIAWCGLTEDDARTLGQPVRVQKIPWGASGRAVGMGEADGVTKIIVDADSELVLGVGIAGANACEMIAEASLAIEMGTMLTDLAQTIHPHPTTVELLSDAATRILTDEESRAAAAESAPHGSATTSS
ncbi:MAG: NAD(P)/FAD-dependent oxidoreductase [Planctomycetota bacterium]